MLFLWIFGDNVEDALATSGSSFLCDLPALGATPLQAFLSPSPTVPNPAPRARSRASSGRTSQKYYLRARVVTVIPLFLLFPLIEVPAAPYLLGWSAPSSDGRPA